MSKEGKENTDQESMRARQKGKLLSKLRSLIILNPLAHPTHEMNESMVSQQWSLTSVVVQNENHR